MGGRTNNLDLKCKISVITALSFIESPNVDLVWGE